MVLKRSWFFGITDLEKSWFFHSDIWVGTLCNTFAVHVADFMVILLVFHLLVVLYISVWSQYSCCLAFVPCWFRGIMRPWLDFWFWRYICLFILYASPLIIFSSLFLTYLLPYLSFPLRIDPLHFQAGCHKKTTKHGFSFLCLCCVVVHFFRLVNFFPYQVKRLAWENVSEMTFFVSSGT